MTPCATRPWLFAKVSYDQKPPSSGELAKA